jgi:hypothetical protein
MLPGTERQLVAFPSYAAAMANSQHPATVASAEPAQQARQRPGLPLSDSAVPVRRGLNSTS